MNRNIGVVFGILGVIFGIVAIFTIVRQTEVAIGFITLSFGVLAIIWTAIAVKSLSKDSSLRKHTSMFLVSLIFLVLFSIWNTVSILAGWRKTVDELWMYPAYVFISVAFLIFVSASYQAMKLGKVFGFGKQAEKIAERIKEKKARKVKAS